MVERFPMLSSCPHNHYLSLANYTDKIPEVFFSEEVFQKYYDWLDSRHKTDSQQLKEYFQENEDRFHKAFLFLAEINQYDWHDMLEKSDEYEMIRFIDQAIHPTYLRLIEAVFQPFAHLVASFSRMDRGKGTDGLDVFNAVEEIRNTDLSVLANVYENTVRNGIAHGGITYLEREIQYQDKKGNRKNLRDSEIITLIDDLVDVCNGMLLAFKVFIFSHFSDGYSLPQQIFLEELQAETDAPWWHIVGCVPSKIASQNQLIIYARPNSRHYSKIQYSTIVSGVLAEFFAPGYDRYFFSMKSPKAWPGWAAFDGQKLREARDKDNPTYSDYQGVLENNLVFYVPKPKLPRILGRLDNLLQSFRIQWPLEVSEFRKKLGQPEIRVRTSKIHRNGWQSVLNGSAYITSDVGQSIDKDLIRKSCGRIIRKVVADARKNCSIVNALRYLPLGYARISIFKQNYRKRRLNSFGLGADLVATVQIQKIGRIQAPDIYGSEIEIKGKYRIAWNRAWLEETRDG